jgi:hypothetical protein
MYSYLRDGTLADSGKALWKPDTLTCPYPSNQIRMWEISPRVNSPKNDDPSLWEPLHAKRGNTTIDALELLRE